MGQRHQIFIKIPNIDLICAKGASERRDKESYKKSPKEFGTKDFTVLAYHHQWLYGNSAVCNALKILEFNKNCGDKDYNYNNIFKENFQNSIGFDGYQKLRDSWLDVIKSFISIFNHPLFVKLGTGRTGYERIHYLNKDEPDMRDHFDNGDNNDGITIIDTINNKYAFMIINTYDEKTDKFHYIPISAGTYTSEFYYPVTNNDPDNVVTEKELKDHKENLTIINKAFKGYELLTENEIAEMWPEYKEIQKKRQKSKTLIEIA